jgi:beta-N-acetylhexosaminidase
LSPAIVDGQLKKKLGFEGLVLSDDIGMSAISQRYSMQDATVGAIAAGCDAVLMCNSTQEAQIAALETVIYSVEQDTLPLGRVEDALARHQRVKERFLGGRQQSSRPLQGRALRAVLGRDEHQAVAAEMARYA